MHFDRFSDIALANAKRILTILEMTEFRWTILDVMEQPEQELEAVFALKALGEKVRAQSREASNETTERI
jgi:hypothetical protein